MAQQNFVPLSVKVPVMNVHSIQFLKRYSLNLFMRARPLLPYIKLCTWIKVRIVRFYFININILLNLLINKSHKNKGFFILWNT